MPFAGYKDFADCHRKVKAKHPKWSSARVDKYCGYIMHKVEGRCPCDLSEEELKRIETEAMMQDWANDD